MAWLKRLTSLVSPLLVLAPIILTLSCGAGSTTQGTAATPLFDLQWPAGYSYDPATATLTVPSSQRQSAVVGGLTVTSITCTVTGPGMTAVTASINPTTLTGTVYVPIGSNRVFSVTITTSQGLTITGSSSPINVTAGFTGPVSITLTPNNPPVITSVTVDNPTPAVSTQVTVTCNATDADIPSGDQLTYQWTTTEYIGPSTIVTTLPDITAAIIYTVPSANKITFTCVVSDLRGGVSAPGSVDINAAVAPPSPPVATAVAGSNQVTLNWGAVTNATGYKIYRDTNPGAGAQPGNLLTTINNPATLTYVDTTAINGTTYYYWMTTLWSGGESAQSAVVSATPGATVFGVGGYVKYSTSPVQNATVKVCNTADSTCIAPVATTVTDALGFYSFTGINNGSYNLRFFAPGGWPSVQPYWQVPITSAGTALFVDQQLTKTPISFTPIGNITLPITFFFSAQPEAVTCTVNIYNAGMTLVSSSGAIACAAGSGSWYFTGPLAVGDYWAVLSAVDGVGNPLLDDMYTHPFNTRSSGPAEVWAIPGDGQISLEWLPVAGATSYNIYWSTTSGVTTSTGTLIPGAVWPYLHTPLTNGTTYYYIVTAIVGGAETLPSFEVAGTPNVGGQGAILGKVYYSQTAQVGVMVSVWDTTCNTLSYGTTYSLSPLGNYSISNLADGNYCLRVDYPVGWPNNIVWSGTSFAVVGGNQVFMNSYLTKWVKPVTPVEGSFLPAGQSFVQATWTANPEAMSYSLYLFDVTGGNILVEGPVSPIAGMVVNFTTVLNTMNNQYRIQIYGYNQFSNPVVNYSWTFTTQPIADKW